MDHSYTLLGWGRDVNPQNWFYNPAYIVNRAYLIMGGTVLYQNSIPLEVGKLYLFRANPEFRVSQSPEDPVDHIFFDFLTDRPLLETDYIEIDPQSDERLRHVTDALKAEPMDLAAPQNPEVGRLFLGLLLHILEEKLLQSVEYSPVTTAALRMLHSRNIGELTVAGMAAELCLNEDYIIRCFKREVGVTPHRYLAMMKKDQAISYLRQDMNGSEIAERLGFGSLSAFSYFFKHETGSNISAFKKTEASGKSKEFPR